MGYEIVYNTANTTSWNSGSSFGSAFTTDIIIILILIGVGIIALTYILGFLGKYKTLQKIGKFLSSTFHYFLKGVIIYFIIGIFYLAYLGLKGLGSWFRLEDILLWFGIAIAFFFGTAAIGYVASRFYKKYKIRNTKNKLNKK